MKRRIKKSVPARSYDLNDGDVLPRELWPFLHELDCGCEYERGIRGNYDVINFCDEHDPTIYRDEPYKLDCPRCDRQEMDVDDDGKVSCRNCKPKAF